MFTPTSSSLLQDISAQILFPEILGTTSFLNNPIQFFVSGALIPQEIIQDLPSGSLPQYSRDVAQFTTVILNYGTILPEVYSILMNSPIYNRTQEERVFNSQFTEF